MNKLLSSVLCAIALSSFAAAAPTTGNSSSVLLSSATFSSTTSLVSTPGSTVTPTTVSTAPPASQTVPLASDDPNFIAWNVTTTEDVQPIRGSLGAKILGPQNLPIDQQNPDLLAPPTTDAGTVPNVKWPFSLSHNRIQTGGWARQQNVQQLPIATSMAGVNMRLEAGAIRELHWHQTAEWAYVLKGTTQITSVDQLGRNYVANVGPGDLWYFPPGIPHSLQGTSDLDEGTEFLLIFPDGNFSDDDTFLLTDWLAHVPKEVLAKNFQTSISAFNEVPAEQLYIFPGAPPNTTVPPQDPQGQVPQPFSFAFSQVKPTQYSGGTAKIADTTNFPIAQDIAVAEVTVEPGAMRELHWHPTQDEWGFFLEGSARVTVFAAEGNAQTFDFEPGDISFTPRSFGHYVENIGNTTLKFLEIFNTPVFQDVSLAQWLALTPPILVKEHLGLSDETIASLNKTKQVVVGPRA
ncbi:oxalate decarboxylase [Cristinia sonorae]|uniref:Oxalate decarboxylase n=1 Tax=Cristinia sonorae TaxID=1940300 RepID=A0A8K0XQL6_9AGAR|nr:oxalate decarboxylase [Cristinia sonorae]